MSEQPETKESNQITEVDTPSFAPSPHSMVLFTGKAAPNPRRVQIFISEHHFDNIEFRNMDMRKGQHKLPEYKSLNPAGQLPTLLLPDCQAIAESVAICRYLESVHEVPSSRSLFGDSPLQCAIVEQWQRRIEIQLFVSGIGRIWVNNPLLFKLAWKNNMKQRNSQRTMGQTIADRTLRMIEQELTRHNLDFVCGSQVSIADITLLCALDFGVGLAGLEFKTEEYPSIVAWWERMNQRESVVNNENPYNAPLFAKMRKASSVLGVVRKVTLGLL